MIITGTTSMAIPSPLVSPFTAYSRSDASYHAYFVFHTTSLSVEESYLDIEADAELSDDIYITVLKHNDLEDCYVIDVICPFYEYRQWERSAVTYHLSGRIYGESLIKHLNIDVNFTQEGCEIPTGPIVETPFIIFTAHENNSVLGLANRSTNQTVFEYSNGGTVWDDFTTGVTVNLNSGDTVYVRGKLTGNNDSYEYTKFKTTSGKFSVYGNINSLWNYEDLTQPLYEYCGCSLFYGCTGLVGTNELVLPATTLAEGCYWGMFSGCVGLITAPELPATTLANWCYYGMFQGCTSLIIAPELPATTLAQYCYSGMFERCSRLTTAPELPATRLAEDHCYASMFAYCSSLTTAPVLPATTLANGCYYGMFRGCGSLTEAPALPATTLTSGCYGSMFYGCTSLTTAPVLPATTLASRCYYQMFQNCTSLTTAPELPATTLAVTCYSNMFYYCSSLTTAPELPATTLAGGCYGGMFQGCSKLNYIKCLAVNGIKQNSSTNNWVQGVAPSGTFVKHPDVSESTWGRGISGIPSNWTVEDAVIE